MSKNISKTSLLASSIDLDNANWLIWRNETRRLLLKRRPIPIIFADGIQCDLPISLMAMQESCIDSKKNTTVDSGIEKRDVVSLRNVMSNLNQSG